jgi:serine/threonine-protein kinase
LLAYFSGRLSESERGRVERLLNEREELRELASALSELSLFQSGRRVSRAQGSAPERASLPPAGSVVGDRYRVIRELGRGAMGVVLEVEHTHLGERRAIKVLRDESPSAETLLRFVREARAAMAIDSPHVARVYDLGALSDGRLFIVMEQLRGQTLRDALAERGPLPEHQAVSILIQACRGVAAAHERGVVHRDLKPANLFLVGSLDDVSVKVLDFGLAKGVANPSEDVTLTTSASVLGSPMYMAPEQIRDARRVDARADVWALGVIFHEMLSGQPPFRGTTVSGLLASIVADAAQPLPASVSRPLARIVSECLSKDPDRRIASAGELLAELSQASAEDGARRRWPVLAVAGVAVAAAIFWRMQTHEPVATMRSALVGVTVPSIPKVALSAAAPDTPAIADVPDVDPEPSVPTRPPPVAVPRPAVEPVPSASAPVDPLLGEATETRR